MGALQAASPDEEPREIFATEDAVDPAVEPLEDEERVVGGQPGGRPEATERVAELRPDRLHVAERDGRREQRHELLVERIGVSMHEADRVAGAARGHVAPAPDRVERALEGRVSGRH